MKNDLRFNGAIQEICPLQEIKAASGKVYYKQEIVVEEVGEQYPNCATFEVFYEQGKSNKIDGMNEGDVVEVTFNMKTKPYNTTAKEGKPSERKMAATNQIWKIDKISAAPMTQNAPAAVDPYYAPAANAAQAGIDNTGGESDLPF